MALLIVNSDVPDQTILTNSLLNTTRYYLYNNNSNESDIVSLIQNNADISRIGLMFHHKLSCNIPFFPDPVFIENNIDIYIPWSDPKSHIWYKEDEEHRTKIKEIIDDYSYNYYDFTNMKYNKELKKTFMKTASMMREILARAGKRAKLSQEQLIENKIFLGNKIHLSKKSLF